MGQFSRLRRSAQRLSRVTSGSQLSTPCLRKRSWTCFSWFARVHTANQ
jgi:hypothetical protein